MPIQRQMPEKAGVMLRDLQSDKFFVFFAVPGVVCFLVSGAIGRMFRGLPLGREANRDFCSVL